VECRRACAAVGARSRAAASATAQATLLESLQACRRAQRRRRGGIAVDHAEDSFAVPEVDRESRARCNTPDARRAGGAAPRGSARALRRAGDLGLGHAGSGDASQIRRRTACRARRSSRCRAHLRAATRSARRRARFAPTSIGRTCAGDLSERIVGEERAAAPDPSVGHVRSSLAVAVRSTTQCCLRSSVFKVDQKRRSGNPPPCRLRR